MRINVKYCPFSFPLAIFSRPIQNLVPSAGCFVFLFSELAISDLNEDKISPIPLFLSQFFITETLLPFTCPVLLSTQVKLILDMKRTLGGTAGYDSGTVIRSS